VHWVRIRFLTRRICKFLGLPVRIRHYLYGSRSFHHQAKKVRKTLISIDLWFLSDINVPSKIKEFFLLASLKPLTKRAGSGSGSVTQWDGSADSDLYEIVLFVYWDPSSSPTLSPFLCRQRVPLTWTFFSQLVRTVGIQETTLCEISI
jgi:hypothetical protein